MLYRRSGRKSEDVSGLKPEDARKLVAERGPDANAWATILAAHDEYEKNTKYKPKEL